MPTSKRFTLKTGQDGLAIAYARMVEVDQGGEPYAYMEIAQCPLCGQQHIHNAEKVYGPNGKPRGYEPSFTRREAQCSPLARREWIKQYPETARLENVYLLTPQRERQLERGSSVVGLLLMFVPVMMVIDLITAIALGGYAQVNVAAAARNCARDAAATLSQNLGPVQGETVGMNTLKQAGLGNRNPKVNVAASDWQRGSPVSCTAQVTVPFGAAGLIGRLIGVHDVTVKETRSTVIETWNSNWNN